ncbi:hypothetical protein [Methanosarcina sp.]|uniref:hypothetical protein n=1 Tax=Methanosarcina sp. TaxID=2213 RepID=UPI002988944A|nr:hypothetical protein [Methanosarcina sp.]MDW5551708.1 hypothetical protein [Methanosarcina sp.]MDW5553210.1 hypothetical protein [Methanosarcina sp.]MDW5558326.1 hypothetical protein [Methanosarcina sp.]
MSIKEVLPRYHSAKLPAILFKKLLACNPFQKTACLQSFSKNCLIASLFKKGLSENPVTFGFENLIPKPYRRDKPAQRFRVNGFGSTVAVKQTDLGIRKLSMFLSF